jgi:dihydrofolate reductase
VYIAMSLDGFIARADGRIDWLSMVERPGEDYGYRRFHDSIDVIVIGRKTYDTALGFDPWPYAGKRCIVMTHRPIDARHGEEVHAGDPAALIARLKAEGARRAYVDGGQIIQQFLAGGLVDDLTVSIIPILLGEGVRLFGTGAHDLPLKMVRSRSFDSGLVQLEYRLTGA